MQRKEKQKNKIAALYPLTKFYLALVVAIITLLLPGILMKFICFVCLCILAAASGVGKLFFKRMSRSVGIIIILMIVIQTLFYPTGDPIFSIWVFTAKWDGLYFALRLGLNFAGAGGALIWNFCVTTERDFVLALEKAGMSPRASYVVLSTLQMVPVMKKRSQVIMNAQKARGVETEGNLLVRAKVFVPTLVPLVLSSIQGTEERALTLEARGFSVETPSTHYYDIHPEPIDKTVKVIITIVLILAIVGRILLWLI
ncbi:MAG: energy-coupling factor transporter transmembrane component T [Lachnospiraceae bacterium]|jgi:energy-coupling factor transport system permease protein